MSGTEIETFEKLSKPVVEGSIDTTSAENGYRDSEIRDLERQLQQLQELEESFFPPANKTLIHNTHIINIKAFFIKSPF